MSASWPEVSLEEITTKLGDGLHGTPKYDPEGKYYFINGNNLKNGKIIVDIKTKRAGESEYLKHRKELNDRTILVSINGTLGNVALYSGEDVFLGKSACYFHVKNNVNKYFIRYVIDSYQFQNYIHSLATGSTIKNVSLKLMRGFTFRLPPSEIQNTIVCQLKSVDEKIEINRQINQTLEQIAQAIFKSWFVDFEPVKAKICAREELLTVNPSATAEQISEVEQQAAIEAISGVSDVVSTEQQQTLAALFPNQIVDSELDEIPEGWEYKKLKEICRVINGRAYKNTEFKTSGTPIVRIQNITGGGKTVYSDLDLPNDKLISKEDFIYAWSATFGPHIWRGEKSIYHYHIWKMEVDENYVSRYFMYLSMFRKTEGMKSAGTGSIFTHLTKGLMENQDILIGNEKINKSFGQLIEPIYKKITALNEEVNSLTQLKDSLLPKLLSGEIDLTTNQKEVVNG